MALPKIGFSIGDINGVGLEVILNSLRHAKFTSRFIPVVYGSSRLINYYKKALSMDEHYFYFVKEGEDLRPSKINVISCWNEEVALDFGQMSAEGGKYAILSLENAVKDLKSKSIDALVTAPIHKKSMEMAGFAYPGHTEFLASHFPQQRSLMLMVHDDLRIGVVTGHIALHDVATQITAKNIVEKANVFIKSLKVDFGIDKPKIAILGLNPHAGDMGLFGNEEVNVIIPAINELKAAGNLAMGPYPADGFFGSGQFAKFDGVLAMYHDQGLVPFKTLAFGGGVNFTAGLPIIRTSPDHGTAFDIAGKNEANPNSIRHATYLALDIFQNRREFENLTSNKLKSRKGKYESGEDEILVDEEG